MGKIIPIAKAPKVVVEKVSSDNDKKQQDEEERRDRQKRASLLNDENGRGIGSTIKTSLRGVLNEPSKTTVQRKTLLGE